MARDSFTPAIAYVLAHEGGYVNDPKDKGGPTNRGITQATLSAWLCAPASIDDVRNLTRDMAEAIYHDEFWNRIHGDQLPRGLDYALFDFGVNSGVGRANRFLQTLLKARKLYGGEIDGVLGAKSLEALAQVNDLARLIGDLSAMRLRFLKTLDGWGRFGKGWARRVAEVQQTALRMASGQNAIPLFGSLPEAAPSARGVGATVAVSRTLPGKAAILSVASAVGEQASEYATTISALQDIAPIFKWAFAILTVIGILAGLAKAIQLAQGNGDIPRVPRAARAPDPVGAPIEAQPAAADPAAEPEPEAPAEPVPVAGAVHELPAGFTVADLPEVPADFASQVVSTSEQDLPELPAEPDPEPAPAEAPEPEPAPAALVIAPSQVHLVHA